MTKEFIEEIKSTEQKLLTAIKGLSEEQSKFKISPVIWSVHECMEHIVITEVGIYRILCKQNSDGVPHAAQDEVLGKQKIASHLADRTHKLAAGDNVKPMGRFSNLNELRDKFKSNRMRIIDALQGGEIVFDTQIFKHPVLGELTKKDWLNFMIHHTERHREQIEEMKAKAGFPAYATSI